MGMQVATKVNGPSTETCFSELEGHIAEILKLSQELNSTATAKMRGLLGSDNPPSEASKEEAVSEFVMGRMNQSLLLIGSNLRLTRCELERL